MTSLPQYLERVLNNRSAIAQRSLEFKWVEMALRFHCPSSVIYKKILSRCIISCNHWLRSFPFYIKIYTSLWPPGYNTREDLVRCQNLRSNHLYNIQCSNQHPSFPCRWHLPYVWRSWLSVDTCSLPPITGITASVPRISKSLVIHLPLIWWFSFELRHQVWKGICFKYVSLQRLCY